MKKNMQIIRFILLFTAIALSACSHHLSDVNYRNSDESDVDYRNSDESGIDYRNNNESDANYNNNEVQETFISFDVVVYEYVEEMADMATNIIRGEILDQHVEWLDINLSIEETYQMLEERGLSEKEIEAEIYSVRSDGTTDMLDLELVTISRVRVLEIFKGSHNVGDIIYVMQTGGEHGSARWTVEGAMTLEAKSEFVLFLVSWEFAGLPYSLISNMQGAYYTPYALDYDGQLLEFNYIEAELGAVSEIDPITISIGDLINIAEKDEHD